jgi:hypothetical protein
MQSDKKKNTPESPLSATDSTQAIKDAVTAVNASNSPNSYTDNDPSNRTTIQWLDSQELDMGKIREGEKLEVRFRFKNTGNKPLVISRVWAQCGCTVPETPKEPYAPGQEGVIKALFDSHGRGGSLNVKEVYVNANTDPITNVLVFKVDVLKKDN